MNPFQGDDEDPFSGVRDIKTGSTNLRPTFASTEGQMDERDRREMEMVRGSGAALKKTKAPIVTKEQLKASGFDNLRDYLNAQKGLTRRDEKAPSKAAPAKAAPAKADMPTRASVASAMDKVGVAPKVGIAAGRTADPTVMKAMRAASGKKDEDEMGMKRGGKVKKYAKGGSVSSASKRADGCAIKGKTRGKMV
jgi:hypothetical protein